MSSSLLDILKSMSELTEIPLGEFSSLRPSSFNKTEKCDQEILFAFQLYLLKNYYETNANNIFNTQSEEIKNNQTTIFRAFLTDMLISISQNKDNNEFKEIDFDYELMIYFDVWKIKKERALFESGVDSFSNFKQCENGQEVNKI